MLAEDQLLTTDEPVVVYAAHGAGTSAMEDLVEGAKRPSLWWSFAVFDIQQRFRRSMLGPLWLTLSMGIMIGSLALVYGTLFPQPMNKLLPYLSAGLILWGFMTATWTEGATAFTAAEGYIRNVPMQVSVHLYRVVSRNLIILCFNMVIYVIVFAIFRPAINENLFLIMPGFMLMLANVLWITLAIAIFSTRFRDIPPIITNFLQVVFFLTPIFWSLDVLPNRPAFVALNPFYHLLDIVRAPLLGQAPDALSWYWAIGMLVIGGPLALHLYRRVFLRIVYWI